MYLEDEPSAFFSLLDDNVVENVEEFVNKVADRNFIQFESEEQIASTFNDFLNIIYNNFSYNDVDDIRRYTGYAFNNINSILRNAWDYESNGLLTEDKIADAVQIAKNISKTINSLPPLQMNIKTYRGVTLKSFKNYGVDYITDLKKMLGQYYIENGFTSTSLLREKSFFNQELEWHDDCNIEIEYLIPAECNDGLPLITDELSGSKSQSEFLINKESITKIVDVKINEDEKNAYLKAILIPQKVWNICYELNKQGKNK